MAGTPPPSRYRVVERDRRLVVIDTWEKGAPASDARQAPHPIAGATPVARPATASRPGIANPRGATGLPAILVHIACMGSDDGAGHRILTTHEYYDAKGPRDIVLSVTAERRLGRALTIFVAAVAAALVIGWFGMPLFVLLFFSVIGINAAMASVIKPALTRWLDGLEAQGTT